MDPTFSSLVSENLLNNIEEKSGPVRNTETSLSLLNVFIMNNFDLYNPTIDKIVDFLVEHATRLSADSFYKTLMLLYFSNGKIMKQI